MTSAWPVSDVRLSRTEIADERKWFAEWHTPEQVFARFERNKDYLGWADFFNQTGIQFIEEAFSASKLSKALGSRMLRACSSERPDYELVLRNSTQLQLEIVVAHPKGREAGREKTPYQYNHDALDNNLAFNTEETIRAIQKVVRQKVKKAHIYPDGTSLLIYAPKGDICYDDECISLALATHEARRHFCNVYALTAGNGLWWVWSNAALRLSRLKCEF